MREKVVVLLAVFAVVGFLFVPNSNSATNLTIAVGQEPTSIDQSLVYLGADYIAVENWGERLLQQIPSGELAPGLATSWKVSPDGKVIEFALRKGVKFHNGDPLTVKDIIFSFDRAREKNNTQKARLRLVEKIEVIDDYHFKIHFKAPDVTFLPLQGNPMIVSKSYYDKVGEDNFKKEPVGTGPYKVVNYVPGEYIDIERFADYWGEKPPAEKVRFLFISEDMTRVSKLKAGEVDFIASVPYTAVPDLENTKGLKLVRSAGGHPTPLIQFATGNPKVPWHDQRVRLALAKAINYDAIIKNILFDIPQRYAVLAPYEIGYDPDLKPYSYDPKKAKELLAEAGYPKGFDLKFYYLMTGRAPMIRETVEAIGAYFGEIGVRTELIGEDAAAFNARRRAARGPDASFVGFDSNGAMAGGVDPCHFVNFMFHTNMAFSVYSNPKFDEFMDQARSTRDDKARGDLARKALRALYDDVGGIPIYSTVPIYGMKDNIDFKPIKKYPFDTVHVLNMSIK